MRGVQVGSIENIKLKLNCVLALAQINSTDIVIPKKSIIETTQTGLLNEPIIDIIPINELKQFTNIDTKANPIAQECDSSNIICNQMYIRGYRGLNYDDLIRSTTRISQRFDDPRFFNLFYVFLQNSIELTDNFMELITSILDITAFGYIYLEKLASKN